MSKSMLINVIQEEESRVAIVDNGVLDFFEIETRSSETLKGNIYKGVVENVNPALEAAFVNCGWDKPGFLPLDEINFKVLPAIKTRKAGSRILEHVAPGMEFLVQVIRDRFNQKPPSLSTYYSLPGRYLVLTPHSDGSGISRRIEDEDQRAKLRQMVEELRPPEGFGVIVRTAGIDQNRAELVRDMGYLLHLWETVERATGIARAPSLIYRERDLALRTIRDHLTDDIEEVLIDDQEVHENAVRFIRAVAPHQEARITLYTGDKPVFTRFNLEEQIETIYKRRVPLKSGGEIVIEQTEGMTAIDVNSARSREATAGESALRTNLEAAVEITRQMRLRDLGGLTVIDFIDMEAPKHLRAVEKALRDAMRPDKAKYDATKISKLGMMEISRQRLKAAKAQATYVTCTDCDGAGIVRTTEAAALAGLRRIQTRVVRGDIASLKATLPTEVALYLLNQKRDELLNLETRHGVRIALIPRPDYAKERCDIETQAREGTAPWVLPHQPRPHSAARDAREAPPAPLAKPPAAPPAKPPAPRSDPGPEDLDRETKTVPVARTGGGARPSRARTPARARAASPGLAAPETIVRSIEPALESEAFEPQGGAPDLPVPFDGIPPQGAGAYLDAGTPSEAVLTDASEVEAGPARETAGTSAARRETTPARDGSQGIEVTSEAVSTAASVPDPGQEGALAGETAGEAPKKKRRRRGGRGRGRKHDGEGAREVASAGDQPRDVAVEEEDAEETSHIVWEDAEEDSPAGGLNSEEPLPSAQTQAGSAGAVGGTDVAPKKRKRRRRGGRGRKKHGVPEGGVAPAGDDSGSEEWEAETGGSGHELSEPGHAAAPRASAARAPRAAQAGAQAAEASARPKRRRKRHRAADRPGSPIEMIMDQVSPAGVKPAIPGRDASAGAASTWAEPADHGAEDPGGEDVPGGWWSRLRGAKKGSGRKD